MSPRHALYTLLAITLISLMGCTGEDGRTDDTLQNAQDIVDAASDADNDASNTVDVTEESALDATDIQDDIGDMPDDTADPVDDVRSPEGDAKNNTQDVAEDIANDAADPADDAGPTTKDTGGGHHEQDTSANDGRPDFPVENQCASGPLEEPIAGCAPTPLASTGDPQADCVRRINQLRWECQCLLPLERWKDGEACADEQAAYDAAHDSYHAGFSQGICSPGGYAQNECPGWGSWERVNHGCLQRMWDEGPGEPYSAHGHYINMTNSRYSRVACGSGGGWFVMNFQ